MCVECATRVPTGATRTRDPNATRDLRARGHAPPVFHASCKGAFVARREAERGAVWAVDGLGRTVRACQRVVAASPCALGHAFDRMGPSLSLDAYTPAPT